MESYIEKVRAHIDAQFVQLDFRNHQLAEWSNVSESKFEKDFKRAFGITANQYIRKKKIEKAIELRQNRTYTPGEIMVMIGWNYSERSYREACKNFLSVTENAVAGDSLMFLKAKSAFDNILLRLVLYLQLGELKKKSVNSAEVIVNVKDTVIQFTAPFALDDKLHLFLHYVLDDDSLLTTAMTTRIGDESQCYIANSLQPYLTVLNNIHRSLENQVDFDIRKSIRNWERLIGSEVASESLMNWVIAAPLINEIEIDFESDFIKATNPLIDELKEQFRTEIRNTLSKDFHLNLDTLVRYAICLQNEENIEAERLVSDELLVTGAKSVNLRAVDLILNVTECPVLRDLQLENYEFQFPRELLDKMSKVNANRIGNILRRFREAVILNSDDEQYDPGVILDDLLRKY